MEAFVQIYKCLPFQTECVALIVVVTDKKKKSDNSKKNKILWMFYAFESILRCSTVHTIIFRRIHIFSPLFEWNQ